MEAPVRVGLIADDDVYFRMAVSAILTRQFGFSTFSKQPRLTRRWNA
jgi:hypothetical protein